MTTPEMNTIVAEATPPGRGGVSIVRLSGPEAISIAQRLVRLPGSRTVQEIESGLLVQVEVVSDEQVVDAGMMVLFRGPHSFTGEDVVELHLHGNPVIVREVIDCAVTLGSVLPAPGEFLRRRFRAGKIDLLQVEALSALLVAEEKEVLAVATRQLDGNLGQRLRDLRDRVIQSIARLELELDFAEESYEFVDRGDLAEFIGEISGVVRGLQRAHRTLSEVNRVPTVLLVGRPNAGKSTLFNAIVGYDRSITHDQAGTTRDYISEVVRLSGRSVRFVDTAGLRDADEDIEWEGIRRALELLESGDLVMWLSEESGNSKDHAEQDADVLAKVRARVYSPDRILFVRTKSDLIRSGEGSGTLAVSVLKPQSLSSMLAEIERRLSIGARSNREPSAVVSERQVALLDRANEVVDAALTVIRPDSDESNAESFDVVLLSDELRRLLPIFDELIGDSTNEEVLDAVFSQFCIGK